MKRALALDMDDLIYPFAPTLAAFHNEHHDTALTADDFHSMELEKVWGGTSDEAWTKVNTYFAAHVGGEADLLPITGADVAVKQLAEYFRLYVVTAREDGLAEPTRAWLTHHFPDTFDDIILCNTYATDGRASVRTKGEVVAQLDAIGLVDDSARHVTEVANQGRLAVLYGDYAWNRGAELPDTVHHARTWPEVLNILLPEGTP